jgi:hypothetical protein
MTHSKHIGSHYALVLSFFAVLSCNNENIERDSSAQGLAESQDAEASDNKSKKIKILKVLVRMEN